MIKRELRVKRVGSSQIEFQFPGTAEKDAKDLVEDICKEFDSVVSYWEWDDRRNLHIAHYKPITSTEPATNAALADAVVRLVEEFLDGKR